MSSFLWNFRKRQSRPQSCQYRPLRVEALERRVVLAPVAALPVSVVLLGQPSNNVTPPDPCIQFNPQPMLSQLLLSGAATSSTPVQWQGHFTEQLRESSSPVASPIACTPAAPATWLVTVVYNLSGQLPAASGASGPFNAAFIVNGTARETLIPLNAAGNTISTVRSWVSTDKISSQVIVSGNVQSLTPSTFTFTTDMTINQLLTPLASTVAGATTSQSWVATITTHATGAITELLVSPVSVTAPSVSLLPQPGRITGSISLQDCITATLSPAVPAGSTTPVSQPWQINAQFDSTLGTFSETMPLPTATTAIVAGSNGTLGLTGSLSETITPPGSGLTTSLNVPVTASVSFWATPGPVPMLLV